MHEPENLPERRNHESEAEIREPGTEESELGPGRSPVLRWGVLDAYRGPIPTAEEFARYALTLPDAPDRLLRMAEGAQAHVQRMHEIALRGEIEDGRAGRAERRMGQVLGFVLAMTAISAGALVGGWFGALIGGTGIAGLASAFLEIYRTAEVRARTRESSVTNEPSDSRA